jgi:hypothetical protein
MNMDSYIAVPLEGTFQGRRWPGFEARTISDAIAVGLKIEGADRGVLEFRGWNHQRSRGREFLDRRFGNGPVQLGKHGVCVSESRQVFMFGRLRLSLLLWIWSGSRVIVEKVGR